MSRSRRPSASPESIPSPLEASHIPPAGRSTELSTACTIRGHIDIDTLAATATLIPVLGLAFLAGNWLHGRLDEQRFRTFVYALLLAAGLTSLVCARSHAHAQISDSSSACSSTVCVAFSCLSGG